MDWNYSSFAKRKSRARSARIHHKSASEPNLAENSTPRFPDNLKHLIHEYVSVDQLKFYRKRRLPNADHEFHGKNHICLYDESLPIIPFASLKTEYMKKFCQPYGPRSHSVPNKFNLNTTTNELLEALRDNSHSDLDLHHSTRAKATSVSGEVEINGIENMIPYANVRQSMDDVENISAPNTTLDHKKSACTLKLSGELTYSPEYRSQYKEHESVQRSQIMPKVNHIKFHGKFHGSPEYRNSYKPYDHFTRSEPIKQRDNLRVEQTAGNAAIVSPMSTSTEYTDQFKQLNLRSVEERKMSKQIDNMARKDSLSIGNTYNQSNYAEYTDKYRDPRVRKFPERAKPRSPLLSIEGDMEYKPEYRSSYIEHSRKRPVTQKPETHFDFFEMPRKSSPLRQPIINTTKFNSNIAIIEPSKNIHHPTGLNETACKYLRQPEVRRARHEILKKKRPPSPNKTIAVNIKYETMKKGIAVDSDEENRIFMEKSRMLTPISSAPVQVTLENVDEPNAKPITLLNGTSPKYGRRASSVRRSPSIDAKATGGKITEGNREYERGAKKASITSTTTTSTEDIHNARRLSNGRKFSHSQSLDESRSFVVLKDPYKQANNKWMKSNWYQ